MKAALILTTLLSLSPLARADQNPGWIDLLDGNSLEGWVDGSGKPVEAGKWVIADGALHLTGKGGGDLFTTKHYGDFELSLEWKIGPMGNSGVKYHLAKFDGKGMLGLEYQVYDDGDKPFGKGATASLYDIVAPDKDTKKMKPIGEWNTSRIRVKDGQIQHFLNGEKVVEIKVGTAEWEKAVAQSKFKDLPDFGEKAGPIMLQDHGSEAWYRNIRIRDL